MTEFLPALVNALGWTLLHFIWQGSLIALALGLLLTLMGHRHIRSRYACSYAALLVCLIVPARELYLHLNASATGRDMQVLSEMLVYPVWNSNGMMSISDWLETHMHDIVMMWLVCVMLLALRMSAGLLWIGTYASPRRSKPDLGWQARTDQLSQQFQIQGRVVLRIADDLSTPLAVGIFRPMILLPSAMLGGMPVELLEMLMAHELAHIKRHDYLLNLVQTAIEMLLFYHPAVWWISKQIRNDREEIADEFAARVTGEPRRLALALSELANLQFTTPQLAQAAHGGNLMSRIKRLVKPEVSTVNWRAAVAILGITTSCLAVYAQANTPAVPADISQQAMDAAKMANERNGDKRPVIDFRDCRPQYPRAALRREEAGVVQLSVLIASEGQILKARVDRSTGFPDLDSAVVTALEGCAAKAVPGQVNGKNAMLWTKVQFVWKLN
ncbi:M56 family metallopeptidase [Undibacterium sp. TJN19]|uniref:M56 family metallopeptidase n=1 Tax=Undibacterium sp. TJN19 TaxID=3413055 RepID=UPI003BEF4F22